MVITLEELRRIAKESKLTDVVIMRPMGISMESIKQDAIMLNKLKSYKLLYGNIVADKLFNMECKNEVYRNKISVCEYFIKELLNEVEKYDNNQKLINDAEQFLTHISKL